KQTAATVSLVASRRRIVFGGSTVLSGQLTPSPGKTAAGVRINLEADPAPFTPPEFKSVASVKTDAAGRFSFTQSPANKTTYRVVAATNPRATSAPVPVGVASRVTISLSTSHPKRGKRVVFRGLITPVRPGGIVRVQKRGAGRWRTVKT